MARELEKIVTAPCTVEEAFEAWTTDEGCRGFFAPNSHIEAKPGGAYELYFRPTAPEGQRGSEGCTVLACQAPTHLAFTWNNPPEITELRNKHTRVDVRIGPDPEGVRLSLIASDFPKDEAWQRSWDYFQRAWSIVLARFRQRFIDGPIDWNALQPPQNSAEST